MNKKMTRRRGVLVAAALAAMSGFVLVRPANAQYAAGQDGHAQDANNRVGSNGLNNSRPGGSAVTSNDIVDRTVTGGRGFRGPVNERDPRAFSGPVPSGLDNFMRQTNNVDSNFGAPGTNGQAQVYYGESRFVAPPAGALPIGFNGGYIGTTLNTPMSLSSQFNTSSQATTLQGRTSDRDTLLMNQAINSGKFDSLDTNVMLSQNGVTNISPIFGLRTYFNANGDFLTRDQMDHMTPDDTGIIKMQDELRLPASLGQEPPQKSENGTQPPQSTSLNQPLNQAVGQSFDAPPGGAISNQLTASPPSGGPMNNTGITSTDTTAMPGLMPAAQQSTLLATLQSRLAQSGSPVGKALEANAPKPATPNNPKEATTGGPAVAVDQGRGPVKVSSLATGVKAKGLHDLLEGAESLMREGKYDLAIQKYTTAQRVAPNNPLALLGRAHAELAGGYYSRAEIDLRDVFRNDPELLLAQFDLPAVLPRDRVAFIRKDLKDLTASDPKAERPWFLLAYLDYNTGDPAAADKDLAEAETRSSRGDWSVRLLRQHWTLPSESKAAPGAGTSPRDIRRTTTPVVPPRPVATQPVPIEGSDLNK